MDDISLPVVIHCSYKNTGRSKSNRIQIEGPLSGDTLNVLMQYLLRDTTEPDLDDDNLNKTD